MGILVAILASLLALPASAQTADDLLGGRELHDIWLQVNGRDWQALRAAPNANTFYPCDVEWRGIKVYNAGCRSRGRASRSGTKPGLLIQFDRYVRDQRFLGLSTLVLDNLWQDPSMLKERVAMAFFRKMGLPAPRESHARVYIGAARELWGVYGVVEDVDERFLQHALGDDTGYLYEYHWLDDYRLTDLGPDLGPYAMRFEPRTHRSTPRAPCTCRYATWCGLSPKRPPPTSNARSRPISISAHHLVCGRGKLPG
jgi:spore coat protein CotH